MIVGHSERRQLFGENDDVVNKKVKAVFAHGMTPIVCVGETLEEREAGRHRGEGARSRCERAFAGVDAGRRRDRASSPTSRSGRSAPAATPTPEDAGRVDRRDPRHARRALRRRRWRRPSAIQYGGSVKPGNIRDLMAHPEIDGALVGGASLDPEDFALIVKYR